MNETSYMVIPEGAVYDAYRLGYKEGKAKMFTYVGIAILATAIFMSNKTEK